MGDYDFHHLNHVKIQHKSKKALWITLLLTLFFTIVEVIGGLLANSLALLSDSAHMASDVAALGLSMTAIYLATKKPNKKFTFGYLRFEILASFLNGLALAVIAFFIFIEAVKRMITPQEIELGLMLTIAVIGLIVNIVLTIVLSRSTKEEENLNIKSALWHFIGDLLNSVGVIISAVLIFFTGFTIFDPIISMVIGTVILIGGLRILRESYYILMEAVPEKFDLDAIRADIMEVEGVRDVHEMHLWTVTSDHYSFTAHVFLREEIEPLTAVSSINKLLKEKYNLHHPTIQVEHPEVNDHGSYGEGFQF
ncbi:cation diffusion facilitator family transporter [Bacillus marinisedimentorum]|uniref:cation diffusion facilitator family transporter n=1 Tax=Bacillus marinisedimentorum TaxID=1821260 RepID=UPI0007DECAF5|nr:cation diffusion facilitator family transporter [Bacillus marinisedimentorum]